MTATGEPMARRYIHVCPIHHRPLICPACAGAAGGRKGGQSKSAAKIAAVKRNLPKRDKVTPESK